jgi:subtilisin family serine protease
MKENSANKWWCDFITHREIIFPPNTLPDSVVPVKIAVVDTGIDTTNPVILQRWGRKMATSSERYRDFLADDAGVAHPAVDRTGYSSSEVSEILASLGKGANIEPSDVSGHGTHLAGIVLQLVPDATLFVARVLERNQGDYDIGAAARRVALVCPHCARGCHSILKSATNFYHRLS